MSNTDLVLALIKCGKVLDSACNNEDQLRVADTYKRLASAFFTREMNANYNYKSGRICAYKEYNTRGKVAKDMLEKLRYSVYK